MCVCVCMCVCARVCARRAYACVRVGLRDPRDKGTMNNRNVGNHLRNDKALTRTSRPEGCHSPWHAKQPIRNHIQPVLQSA